MNSVALEDSPIATSDTLHSDQQNMAASMCCTIFQDTLVPYLCYEHARPDQKLTSTERARITSSFFTAWELVQEMRPDGPVNMKEEAAGLGPVALLHVREIVLFMVNNLSDQQHREIATMMGYKGSRGMVEEYFDLLTVILGCFEEKGISRFDQPDFAPLGLGLLFDDWQEEIVEPQAEVYWKKVA